MIIIIVSLPGFCKLFLVRNALLLFSRPYIGLLFEHLEARLFSFPYSEKAVPEAQSGRYAAGRLLALC